MKRWSVVPSTGMNSEDAERLVDAFNQNVPVLFDGKLWQVGSVGLADDARTGKPVKVFGLLPAYT